MSNSTFLRTDLNDTTRLFRLKNYWKAVILRNPLHRLVSAYRDKIIGLDLKPHEKVWSALILKKFNLTSPNFESYLRWIMSMPQKLLNEHFAPMVEILQPCRVGYHYFGNFNDISTEMSLIAAKLGVPLKYFQGINYHPVSSEHRTDKFLSSYYASVSDEVKQALFLYFYTEFEFYYTLFPEESDSHIRYLGIQENIRTS